MWTLTRDRIALASSAWLGLDFARNSPFTPDRVERMGALEDHHDAMLAERTVPGSVGADGSTE